jgi:hypothetical protein
MTGEWARLFKTTRAVKPSMNRPHREESIKDPEKGEMPRGFEAKEEWVNYRIRCNAPRAENATVPEAASQPPIVEIHGSRTAQSWSLNALQSSYEIHAAVRSLDNSN